MIRTVPSLKRKARAEITGAAEKVVLDRVFGITVCSNSSFVSHPDSGLLAYPAGCVIVIVDVKRNKQTHLVNASKKTIVSLSFCSDGKHLASGESGHAPAVRVWDIESGQQVAEFFDHKFSVPCVAFSPNQKYLFSIGNQFDNMINVWNWRTGIKVASNKNTQKVNMLCFAPDSSHAVSVGLRHVKFWYLQLPQKLPGAAPAEAVPLTGKVAPLGDLQNNNFACSAYPNERSLVAVTYSGILCQFTADNRQLQQSCTIKTKRAYCLAANLDDGLLYVGCANGTIRVFNGSTLEYVGMLPRPHKLGVDLRARIEDTDYVYGDEPDSQVCADTIALVWIGEGRVAACYSDHSVYVWTVNDLDRVVKAASWLFHSSKIWGIDIFPATADQALIPQDSFITCSGDDTVRIWNFDSSPSPSQQLTNGANSFKNPFSKELLKIIYVDSNHANLCDSESLSNAGIGVDQLIGGSGANPSSLSSFISTGSSSVASTPSSGTAPPLPADNRGVRCVTVSPDGRHLCAGLRVGNINIYDLQTFELVLKVEAHDGEILALEYSRNTDGPQLLASGGRDRIVHVLDATKDYSIHQTFDTDHSSSINALKFAQKVASAVQANGANGSSSGEDRLQMILMSCSADKSILMRTAEVAVAPYTGAMSVGQFSLTCNVGNKSTLYDMETDPNQRFVAVACQDRFIRVYSIATGKLRCKYRGSPAEDGQLVRFSLDPTGSLFAAACSDKTVSIVDFYTGEVLATLSGHSEQITGVKFLPDLKRFVTVSADSCIFVWRLSNDLTKLLLSRLAELQQGIVRPLSIKASAAALPAPAIKKLGATRSTSVEEQLSSLAGSGSGGGPSASAMRKSSLFGSTAMVASASQIDINGSANNGRNSATDKPTPLDQLPEWALKQLKETSVDDPTPTSSASSFRPSTRARWEDRRAINGGGPLIIKTDLGEHESHVPIDINSLKQAWVSFDDDEEVVEDEEDAVILGPGADALGHINGHNGSNGGSSPQPPMITSPSSRGNGTWLAAATKGPSPPKSASRLWSRLPAAGPASPRQSTTDDNNSNSPPTVATDDDNSVNGVQLPVSTTSTAHNTLPLGRSPSNPLSGKVGPTATQTPPTTVSLKKLLEQQQQQHLAAANKLRSSTTDDPAVFKKPAPVDAHVPPAIRPSQLVRRSRTATDLAAAAAANGVSNGDHQRSTTASYIRLPTKQPAFMQPTMSSAAKNTKMTRSSSSSTIATIAQLAAANGGHIGVGGSNTLDQRHSTTATSTSSTSNGYHSSHLHRPANSHQKVALFQSTPDLSSGLSASAAVANAIFSETDTEPEDNASSVGGSSATGDQFHDQRSAISLPRSPAARKAYAMRAMRNRNRSEHLSTSSSMTMMSTNNGGPTTPTPKVSISATFDDDDEEEDSGVQQDSVPAGPKSPASTISMSALVASPSPQPSAPTTLSPMDLDRALAAVGNNSQKQSLGVPNQAGDVGQFKSKVLANVIMRAASPALSSDSSSTGNTSSSESPGDILRRELEREKRAMRASPLASSPQTVQPPPVTNSLSATKQPPIGANSHAPSPLRRVPIVGIVHPSNPSTTSTIPADPTQGPLVRLIESASTSLNNGADDDLKASIKSAAISVISEPIPENGSTPENGATARMLESPVSAKPLQTPVRRVSTGTTPQQQQQQQSPLSNGSPQQLPSKRPSVVLLSNLRRPLNSPQQAGASSPVAVNGKPSPQQQAPDSNGRTSLSLMRHEAATTRDRSVSVENLSALGNRSRAPLGSDNSEETSHVDSPRSGGYHGNNLHHQMNGQVSDLGSSMQQRKMAFSSMSVVDLRSVHSSSRPPNGTMNGHHHNNMLDPAEEQEHIEDLIKAWQGLTTRIVNEFDRFHSISRLERSVAEERNRKRLLQVMLEARRQFDRCQERASEDLFS